jgi:rhamnulokinase/L-fuculokinase
MKIIAACGHDTQCAMVSVPAKEKDFAFLSCGTWSLLGTELDNPVINENSAKLNVSNETGYGKKTSFLKNIIGLWLIQESRRQWKREGKDYSFMELEEMAKKAEPFKCFIDPDAPEFTPAGNIPERIKQYCEKTGQYVPKNDGEIMRCIYESLALKYRQSIEELEACTEKSFSTLYMVGGGTKDRFLSQLTACAINRKVCTGPIEATSFGNIAIQLISIGAIEDIEKAREVIARSEKLYEFAPSDARLWDKAYSDYIKVIKQ